MIFYESYFEAINSLSDEDRLALYDAIMRYQFLEEEPDLTGYLHSIFTVIRPSIDTNNKKAEAGKAGGRPAKDTSEKKQKSTGSKDEKPMVSKNKKPMVSESKTYGSENQKPTKEVEVDVEVEEEVKQEVEVEQEVDTLFADVPAVILNDGSDWRPEVGLYEEWDTLYPNVNLQQEFAEIRAWCLSNPTKRKTLNGVKKFVNSWLQRAQNQPRPSPRRINQPINWEAV